MASKGDLMVEVEFSGLTKRYDDGTLAVNGFDLEITDGEFLVLVGPSGCGKSTTLRMLAGLETPTEGTIRIDGAVVNHLPPGLRGLGMVFQSYALYPHMTVGRNLSFGLMKQRGEERLSDDEIKERVMQTAEILDLSNLLDKKPKELSGGQRQRVALGRALVRRPKVLLMDEPLSNLDAKLRSQMRVEIRRIHDELGTTTVYVTHDQVEAMTLADRIAIMEGGMLQQHAPPMIAYHEPANSFVASFLGTPPMNLIKGEVKEGRFISGDLDIELPEHLTEDDGPATFGLRPENVRIIEEDGITCSITAIERLGAENIYHLDADGHRILALWHRPGEGASSAESIEDGSLHISLTEPSAMIFRK